MDKRTEGVIQTTAAMGCIASVTVYALSLGIDGVVLSAAIAIIAGLGGYKFGTLCK